MAAVPRSNEVWTIYYTQFNRFTDPVGAGSQISLKIDSAQLQSARPAPDLSSLRGKTISAFFDGRGQLLRTEPGPGGFSNLAPDMAFRLYAIAAATAPSFPQEPVEPGDRWTMTLRSPLEEFGRGADELAELQFGATLNAIRESSNDKIAEVAMQGSLPTRETRASTSLGSLPARSSGSVVGQYRFSLRRSVMLSQELSGTLMLVSHAPMLGRDTLLSRLVTQTTIRLR